MAQKDEVIDALQREMAQMRVSPRIVVTSPPPKAAADAVAVVVAADAAYAAGREDGYAAGAAAVAVVAQSAGVSRSTTRRQAAQQQLPNSVSQHKVQYFVFLRSKSKNAAATLRLAFPCVSLQVTFSVAQATHFESHLTVYYGSKIDHNWVDFTVK